MEWQRASWVRKAPFKTLPLLFNFVLLLINCPYLISVKINLRTNYHVSSDKRVTRQTYDTYNQIYSNEISF